MANAGRRGSTWWDVGVAKGRRRGDNVHDPINIFNDQYSFFRSTSLYLTIANSLSSGSRKTVIEGLLIKYI
jgi:hypothetical protein